MAKDKAQGRRRSPFEVLMMILATLIGSLIFSILLEWVGMVFFWEDEGVGHSRSMIIQEISYLNDDLIHATLFGVTPREAVDVIFNYIFGQPFSEDLLHYERTLFKSATQSSAQAAVSANAFSTEAVQGWWNYFSEMFSYIGFFLREFAVAAIYITMVAITRISIIIMSLPLFSLFLLVSVVDGLAQRDLRRFGGARESGTRYHFSKAAVLPILLFGWLIYISIPFSIHPNLVLLPLALMFAMSIYLAIANYKKYF